MTENPDGPATPPSGSPPARKGLMLVLSSPSGAGKTSLARRLLEVENGIAPSISVTTRERRANESDGVDYRFVTVEKFTALRDGGELLEWANVFGNLYGTPRAPVERTLAAGVHTVVITRTKRRGTGRRWSARGRRRPPS